MRIPVNDSHNEKLLPYFAQTFQFVGKLTLFVQSHLIYLSLTFGEEVVKIRRRS